MGSWRILRDSVPASLTVKVTDTLLDVMACCSRIIRSCKAADERSRMK